MKKPDFDHYKQREQAYVKHCLLADYLVDWGYKVGTKWESIVYIDGFAGPWGVTAKDCTDSSFGIATEALSEIKKGQESKGKIIRTYAILVEKNPLAFDKLNKFVISKNEEKNTNIFALKGDFISNIFKIQNILNDIGGNIFRFILLDPKGWKDIPMSDIQPLVSDRSCEVLITLMTRDINRFLEATDRADSYEALFGRTGVLEKILEKPSGNGERVEQTVREYCKSLKLLCKFNYVSQAVILEPTAEAIRYFLIYATNHHRGIEVFKKAETHAARYQDQARAGAKARITGQCELFQDAESLRTTIVEDLRRKYLERTKCKIYNCLKEAKANGVLYRELFCEAMAFPLVTKQDLDSILDNPNFKTRLELKEKRSKKPSLDCNDYIYAINQ